MTSKDIGTFTTNPEYIELTKFLIEKAENITPPINVWKLCREFKSQSRVSQTIECLRERVHRFSSIVQGFQAIDMNIKVKLLFGLGVPLYSGVLKELHKHADVTLDSSRRIIDYKEKGGTLQLNGQHVMIYSFHYTKFFKEATGASETTDYLRSRQYGDFNMETKIRMLFVSGAELHDYVLEELRCDANVEVDQLNRIMKYEAKNGSLILKGDQNRPDRVEAGDNESMKTPSMSHLSDSDADHEDNNETIENKDMTTRSGRISKVTDFFKNQELRPSTSEKRKQINKPTGSNSNTPKIGKKRKFGESMVGSSSSKKSAEETESMNETVEDDDISFDYTQPIEFHKRVKLEPFEGVLIDRTIDKGDDDIQLYFPDETEPLLIPKQECHPPYQIKFDRPNYLLFAPVENEPQASESVKLAPSNGYVSQSKILDSIKALVLNLDLESLEQFQKTLDKKIKEMRVKKFPISGFLVALESCFFLITNGSSLKSTSESISLLEFLSLIRNNVYILKFDGLDGFMEKLKSAIKELRVNDKRVPVEKVQIALQTTLNILTN